MSDEEEMGTRGFTWLKRGAFSQNERQLKPMHFLAKHYRKTT